MVTALGDEDVPWEQVRLYQVDERVAPDGDPARNLTRLLDALPTGARPRIEAMHVGGDLGRAAAAYAASLVRPLDLVHLGLGDDGHTASLVPGDPVLDVADRDVAVTGVYRGHRRMTLTFPPLDSAREALWLVTGADKSGSLAALLAGDREIPAGRVRTARQVVLADAAAAGATASLSRPGR